MINSTRTHTHSHTHTHTHVRAHTCLRVHTHKLARRHTHTASEALGNVLVQFIFSPLHLCSWWSSEIPPVFTRCTGCCLHRYFKRAVYRVISIITLSLSFSLTHTHTHTHTHRHRHRRTHTHTHTHTHTLVAATTVWDISIACLWGAHEWLRHRRWCV